MINLTDIFALPSKSDFKPDFEKGKDSDFKDIFDRELDPVRKDELPKDEERISGRKKEFKGKVREKEDKDSRCYDFKSMDIDEGVVGILEGFGLLDKVEGHEVIALDKSIISLEGDIKPGEEVIGKEASNLEDFMVIDQRARKPKAHYQVFEDLFEEVYLDQEEIDPLIIGKIGEDSLESANNLKVNSSKMENSLEEAREDDLEVISRPRDIDYRARMNVRMAQPSLSDRPNIEGLTRDKGLELDMTDLRPEESDFREVELEYMSLDLENPSLSLEDLKLGLGETEVKNIEVDEIEAKSRTFEDINLRDLDIESKDLEVIGLDNQDEAKEEILGSLIDSELKAPEGERGRKFIKDDFNEFLELDQDLEGIEALRPRIRALEGNLELDDRKPDYEAEGQDKALNLEGSANSFKLERELSYDGDFNLKLDSREDIALEENILNIVDSIKYDGDDDIKEFTIMLRPDHLGELKISLSMDKEGIKAFFQVENSLAEDLIRDQAQVLQEELMEKGINIISMDIRGQSYDDDSLGQRDLYRAWDESRSSKQKNLGSSRIGRELGQREFSNYGSYGRGQGPRSIYSSVEFIA